MSELDHQELKQLLKISAQGYLEKIKQVDSPNCDDRPEDTSICLIVIHGISLPPEQFGGDYIENLFCNQLDSNQHPYFNEIAGLKVSAHLLIKRDGEVLQFVPFSKRAWHAGISSWKDKAKCNDFSIGIELEGTDTVEYTDEQYQQLNILIASLRSNYPDISKNAIVGHCDIAPGRKTDPGEAFDWARINIA